MHKLYGKHEAQKGEVDTCIAMTEIRNDCLAEGHAKGVTEGLAKGRAESAIEFARTMLADGMLPLAKIAEYSGLPLEKVKELAQN